MALPSSPPLLPIDEDSQPLPTATATLLLPHAFGSSAPIRPANRKRQHSDYENLSSDPLFSDTTEEDEGSQDVDELPRRKRQVKGPWWRLRGGKRSLRAKKESFKNTDSGVFMGSDASEESVDSVMSSQHRMRELAMEDIEEEPHVGGPMVVTPRSRRAGAPEIKRPDSDPEAMAACIVQRCVEDGNETVDLSGIALSDVQDATLAPLRTLMRNPLNDAEFPPDEETFAPLFPSLKVYLATNKLTIIPNELFNLGNITVLSLRANQLTHLPPAIGRLTRLKELNIAGNAIRHLPWQLLDLIHCRNGRHRNIILRPNPLVQPCDLSGPSPLPKGYFADRAVKSEELSRWADTRGTVERMRQRYTEDGVMNLRGELELRLKLGRMLRIQYLQEASRAGHTLELCREELIYLGSSSVSYFGIDGSSIRRPGSAGKGNAAAHEEQWLFNTKPTAYAPLDKNGSSTVPSLFELSLRALQSHCNLRDSIPDLPDMDLPKSVTSALLLTATQQGDETCSTCGRKFVIARAEWMEYWFNGFPAQRELTEDSVLPFLRKACSWGCAKPTNDGEFKC